MLKEKVRALIKSLPQRYRRHCVPIDKYADGFFERTGGVQIHSKTLVDALIADIREQTGTACERTDFKLEMLQPHLFMNFKVLDEHGRQIGMGRIWPNFVPSSALRRRKLSATWRRPMLRFRRT